MHPIPHLNALKKLESDRHVPTPNITSPCLQKKLKRAAYVLNPPCISIISKK
jgi:hypothetical protein